MDRYIGKQIVAATIFGVIVLSVLLVMGNLFKELRPLLVEEHASPALVLRFIFSVLPFSLIYTIPWGFLVAVLLVFGRLSAENELVSMRMAGVGLLRVAMPVYVIAFLLCCLCLWLNISMAPKAKDEMKFVLYEAVKANPNAMLDPGVVQTRFQGQKIFVESRDGDVLKGMHLYELDKDNETGFPKHSIYAREAKLKIIQESKQIRLQLTDAYIDARHPDGNRELPFLGEWEPLLFDFAADRKKRQKASTMTNAQIREVLADDTNLDDKKRYKFNNEIHRRYAFSMACMALSLVAVPLGINARRKETSTGLAISILVGLGYFLFFMIADSFEKKPGNTALFLYWLPNIVCLGLGIMLFSRARRK
ncbi:MAG: YjgP/YjgQ family permease [Akkermansiaceae bacterium]|nr:YjgP/YjgQ family permease [Akkermansiaceae bacterium]